MVVAVFDSGTDDGGVRGGSGGVREVVMAL